MCNILTEQLIRYDKSGGDRANASLPEVYASLMADQVEAFPALRPHQRHAWHAFLVQLGAMAMHRAGMSEPPKDPEIWGRMIRGLTPGSPNDEPWQLVVDDITKPAFMQPPAGSKDRESDYRTKVATPDELDMLVTSKNHDLKAAVAIQSAVDDWLYALITLQTMEGYGGKYNYGISRMPSGYGNRPAFSLSPSARPGTHFRHDLLALLGHRQTILDEYPMIESGIGLLWVIPWDGTKVEAKPINELEPFYVEVCRRVRLRWSFGKTTAVRANSDDRRIVDVKGLTGDPWMPVSNNTNPKGTPPAFLTQRRFGYERVVDGLFSADWKQPFLLSPASSGIGSSGDMELVARGMVRGEGGTAGYHEKVIPLRHRMLQVFGKPGGREELGDIARDMIQDIGKVQDVLKHSIATFAARGNSNRKVHNDGKPSPNGLAQFWINKLDEIVDERFFKELQTEAEVEEGKERTRVLREWIFSFVIPEARSVLNLAQDSLPCPSIERYHARASAHNVFYGRIHQEFGFLLDESEEG